ncbi:MAG: amidohydrolase family protein [Anaerosomatales bacterium]|nr:amidohydrolase family protein [Anaerosomatales bacterium]MDT8433666.1 amidohydrolase family protein [Anaerosomatales bacterium]
MPSLQPAGSTQPGDVIDTHCHLFTVRLLEEYVEAHPDVAPRFRQAVKERKFGRRGESLPDLPAEEMAVWYTDRIHAAGLAKALIVSVIPDSSYMREFVVAAAGHVHALCNVDPRDPGAADLLEREMAAGFKGVKLLPVNRCFRLSDPACRPFFEKAAELGAPMIVHYGVTVDPGGDMRYADPTDLSPVARDFPEITFVIAHFGAGYLDQLLKVAYQCPNVAVDSSGTNNWMDFMAHPMTLAGVFEQVLGAIGPERVLFGTDSGSTAPYRSWIKYQQLATLESIGLGDAQRDLIVRGNAARIFKLDG